MFHRTSSAALALILLLSLTPTAQAHKLRLKGETVTVAGSTLCITPSRDWNSLSLKRAKHSETWTLDGEQLNDVTFFAGIAAGDPLFREKSKTQEPLPKFSKTTLLVEIPELLESSYRAYKKSNSFMLLSTEPGSFLGRDGVIFTYDYADENDLIRKGEARATIIDGRLYMMSFDAPRIGYFDRVSSDFRALVSSARLR